MTNEEISILEELRHAREENTEAMSRCEDAKTLHETAIEFLIQSQDRLRLARRRVLETFEGAKIDGGSYVRISIQEDH
jgi:hypothetical protein